MPYGKPRPLGLASFLFLEGQVKTAPSAMNMEEDAFLDVCSFMALSKSFMDSIFFRLISRMTSPS